MFISKDNTGRAGRVGFRLPQWSGRERSPSFRLRGLLHDVVGSAYDRSPCPHVRRTPDLIVHPLQDPLNHHGHRTVVRWVETPCVRPADHVRESVAVSDGAGGTTTVPDAAARLHADDAGRTWE